VILPRQSIPVDFSIMSVFVSNASPPERVKLTPVFEEDDGCLPNLSVLSPVYVKKDFPTFLSELALGSRSTGHSSFPRAPNGNPGYAHQEILQHFLDVRFEHAGMTITCPRLQYLSGDRCPRRPVVISPEVAHQARRVRRSGCREKCPVFKHDKQRFSRQGIPKHGTDTAFQ
jgi:hypothetical protein